MSEVKGAVVPVLDSVSSSSSSNPKRSFLRRLFDLDYPPQMDGEGEQQQERPRERPKERLVPETQVVYGFWEAHPTPAPPSKTVDTKARVTHARSMSNLRSKGKSQAQGDTASQVGFAAQNSSEDTSMKLEISTAAVDNSPLVKPCQRKSRAASDAAASSHSESGTIIHQKQYRSKKSSPSSIASVKPNTSPTEPSPKPNRSPRSVQGSGANVAQNFELTPLSGLIKQSFKDVETLKLAHRARICGKDRAGEDTDSGSGNGASGTELKGTMIDFDKVEENLRRFEELYRAFLRYGGAHGGKQEEVHLVAMVCKRSELINGKMGSGEAVPLAKVPDCGY